MKTPRHAVLLLCACSVLACATPRRSGELLDAQRVYAQAERDAARRAPAEVAAARQALEAAERAFARDPQSPEVSDRAYIAVRRAQIAMSRASMSVAKARRDAAAAELRLAEGAVKRDRYARFLADAKLFSSLKNRNDLQAVVAEPRGLVITLPADGLFVSSQAQLSPGGQAVLGAIAEALKDVRGRSIIVESHTDAPDARGNNRDLSQRRSQAVREQLVARGLSDTAIRALGYGADRPVADNHTAEARARNRRIEIVLAPAQVAAQ